MAMKPRSGGVGALSPAVSGIGGPTLTGGGGGGGLPRPPPGGPPRPGAPGTGGTVENSTRALYFGPMLTAMDWPAGLLNDTVARPRASRSRPLNKSSMVLSAKRLSGTALGSPPKNTALSSVWPVGTLVSVSSQWVRAGTLRVQSLREESESA